MEIHPSDFHIQRPAVYPNLGELTVVEQVLTGEGPVFLKAISPHDTGIYWIAVQRTEAGEAANMPVAGDTCHTVQNLAERMLIAIQEKARAEEKLRWQERFYKGLLENAFDCVMVKDREGKVCYVSPGIRSFGLEPEQLIGQNGFELFHPDDLVSMQETFKSFPCGPGEVHRSIHRIRFPNGQTRTLEVVGRNMLHDEAIQGFIINFRDISEQFEAEARLAQRERYFRSLVEDATDVVSIADGEGNFFYTSPPIERLLGYTPEEYTGLNGRDLVHPAYVDRVGETFTQVLQAPGTLAKTEFLYRHKNGQYVFLEVLFKNMLHDEAVRGVVMNSRDITERKEAERLLKAYNENLEQEVARQTRSLTRKNKELEKTLANLQSAQLQLVEAEKMASLGQLTAGIAHEINNPINFVSANVGPLKTDFAELRELLNRYQSLHQSSRLAEDLSEIRRYGEELDVAYLQGEVEALLNGIEEGAGRTKEIVIGLRNFSRLDELDLKTVNVHEGIDSTLMLLRSKLKNRLAVVKEYGNLPDIECYPGKLNQVFMNILSNAIAATPGEGTITIRTWQEDAWVNISIKDTGTGMTEKVKRHIFEPFYTTKEVGEGTGLGLSISYGIIQKHNGKIDVYSEPGKGSEFVVTLPVRVKG